MKTRFAVLFCALRRALAFGAETARAMADHFVPHFHNQPGLAKVRVRARQFMCVGALPPFDHPHVFLDMGQAEEKICPYCSTLFVYDSAIEGACAPAECVFRPAA